MNQASHRNGGNDWPDALRVEPVPLPELPDHPTQAELARAYGSVVITWSHYWPKLVEAFQWLYGLIIGRLAVLRSIDERLASIETRLANALGLKLPPMRAEMASSHELANAVARDVARQYDEEAKNPSTPPPDARTVEALVSERVANELLKIKAADLEKREQQRLALEAEKKKSKRKVLVSATIGGISIVVAVIDHFLK